MLSSQKAEIAVSHGLSLFALLLIPAGYQFGIETIENKLSVWQGLGAAAVLAPLSILLSHVFDRNLKYNLIYLKQDKASPGYRVQDLCRRDERFIYSTLQKRWANIFGDDIDNENLNALWYNDIYRRVRDLPAVSSANKRFMLARDVYCSCLFALLAMTVWLIGQHSILPDKLMESTVLIFLVIVVVMRYAAKSAGEDLIKTAVSEAMHTKDNVPA